MFERYTEKARRVIFFARYEASQYGSRVIDTEHLLLGLCRESKPLMETVLGPFGGSIREEIEANVQRADPVPTRVEIPLSQASKRALSFAAAEAEHLGHKHIGTEHLVLGILREEDSRAAVILRNRGVGLNELRGKLAGQLVGETGRTYPVTRVPIGTAVDELLDAWSSRDAKKLASLFAAHGQLWDVHGELWLGPAQVEKGLAAHFASAQSHELASDIRDVKFVTAQVSIATLVWEPQGETKKSDSSALRMVLIFCDAHPGWLVISAHLALLQPGASKRAHHA